LFYAYRHTDRQRLVNALPNKIFNKITLPSNAKNTNINKSLGFHMVHFMPRAFIYCL